jgi:hypothetical protein
MRPLLIRTHGKAVILADARTFGEGGRFPWVLINEAAGHQVSWSSGAAFPVIGFTGHGSGRAGISSDVIPLLGRLLAADREPPSSLPGSSVTQDETVAERAGRRILKAKRRLWVYLRTSHSEAQSGPAARLRVRGLVPSAPGDGPQRRDCGDRAVGGVLDVPSTDRWGAAAVGPFGGKPSALWFSPRLYDGRPAGQAEWSHLGLCPARCQPTAAKLLVARSATLAAPQRPNNHVTLDPDPPAGNGPEARTVDQRQVQRPSSRQFHARPGPGPPSHSTIIR